MIPSEYKEQDAQYSDEWNKTPAEDQAELTPIQPDPKDPFALGWQDGEKLAMGDGVSMNTHRAMKAAGVGPYDEPVEKVASDAPMLSGQVGSTTLTNESGLRKMLSTRGITTKSDQDDWIGRYKKAKGLH